MARLREWLRSLLTLHGSPRGIAAGFAVGLGLSLVPIPFAGMIVALALVPILGISPVATYLGTAVVNPVTGPLFYFFELWIGMRLCGRVAPVWSELASLDAAGWWAVLRELMLPFALGVAVVVPCAGLLAYGAVLWAVRRWRSGSRARSQALSSTEDRRGSVDDGGS